MRSHVTWHSHVRGGAQLRALVALLRCAQAWRHLVVIVSFSTTFSRGLRNKIFFHVYGRSGAAVAPPPGDAPYGSAAAMDIKAGNMDAYIAVGRLTTGAGTCVCCIVGSQASRPVRLPANPFKPR